MTITITTLTIMVVYSSQSTIAPQALLVLIQLLVKLGQLHQTKAQVLSTKIKIQAIQLALRWSKTSQSRCNWTSESLLL